MGLSLTLPWGFYGHRLINRMAVYTLPPPLVGFFKQHIEYISEHSIDPDKRRYATKHEAVRHYIDIDVWGDHPFEEVPRLLPEAILKYGELYAINGVDTIGINYRYDKDSLVWFVDGDSMIWDRKMMLDFLYGAVMPYRYEDSWFIPASNLDSFGFDNFWSMSEGLLLIDHFSEQGILPYHLEDQHRKLVNAMIASDYSRILQLAAEYGHYIGDAHVPLHTTVNYNGQLTNQLGIHAFWESRIPELFAERDYDFLVGGAEYIEEKRDYFWEIIEASHMHLDSVLGIEKALSLTFPQDRQYCYDDRLSQTIRIQCPEYAAAYQARMNGMVEERMQDAIKAIGNLWYTAWVDAGQPDLRGLKDMKQVPIVDSIIATPGFTPARSHDN